MTTYNLLTNEWTSMILSYNSAIDNVKDSFYHNDYRVTREEFISIFSVEILLGRSLFEEDIQLFNKIIDDQS